MPPGVDAATHSGPVRFLFVDDDTDFLDTIKEFFGAEMPEVAVDTEATPTRALARLPVLKPDLVFADLRLPEMSGVEFLKRAHEVMPTARFVLLTAYGGEAVRATGSAHHGIDLVLLKPVTTRPFLQRVRQLLAAETSKTEPKPRPGKR